MQKQETSFLEKIQNERDPFKKTNENVVYSKDIAYLPDFDIKTILEKDSPTGSEKRKTDYEEENRSFQAFLEMLQKEDEKPKIKVLKK